MFIYKGPEFFKIKKARGIFLYDYASNKIKNLSNHNSLFRYHSKYITTSLKNLFARGLLFPNWNKESYKKEIIKTFFINNNLLRKSNLLKFWEKNPTNLKKTILEQLKNKTNLITNKKLFILQLLQNNNKNIIFFTPPNKMSWVKSFNISNTIFTHNFNDFKKAIDNNSNAIIYTYSFPYWLKFKEYKDFFNINSKSSYIDNYYNTKEVFSTTLKAAKQKEHNIIIDGSNCEFVFKPELLHFNLMDFYDKDLSFDSYIWDYYIFGSNLVNNPEYGIIISKKDLNNNINEIQSNDINYPSYKLLIMNYNKLNNLQIYDNFHHYIKQIDNNKDVISIGPYFTSYSFLKNFDNKEKLWEKYRIYSEYEFMKMQLDIREQDIKSIAKSLN